MGQAMSERRRSERVAELIRHHVVMLLRALGDARLNELVVTGVKLSEDLGIASIYVRSLVGDDDPKRRKSLLAALERAKGRVRHGLAPRIELKKLPELRFFYDTGQDNAARVDELLREIHREQDPD
jgi:ribosome-binding factor A